MCSVPAYTLAEKGANEVSMNYSDDKRQITLSPTISLAGDCLPFQVIFQVRRYVNSSYYLFPLLRMTIIAVAQL
jgi:hypothetical protein